MEEKVRSVLVAGAGVAGIHAALNLANLGFKVYLLDKEAAIGGKMSQLYRTAEDNFALGAITPIILEASNNPNIQIMPLTQIEAVNGEPGAFTVSLKKAPRYVDIVKCVTCSLCWRACPVKVPSEFNYGLGTRNAIYMPYGGAAPNKPSIDPETCLNLNGKEKCTKCADVCPSNAINFNDKETMLELKVGALILTPGIEPFKDAPEVKAFGYGKMANVLDNFQMDRLVSIYGPTAGELKRPSDGKIAKKIAFIQCVGSRKPEEKKSGAQNLKYCSSICCMHAIRSSLTIKGRDESNDISIFHNDIMAIAKTNEDIYSEARQKAVQFIRSQVTSVSEVPDTKDVLIHYLSEDGKEADETFDLVVLSLGLVPSKEGIRLMKTLGIKLNAEQFPELPEYSRMALPGVAIAGSFRALADSPEAVADAQAAVMEVVELLASVPDVLPSTSLPPETDVAGGEPRVGVYICDCGGIIPKVIDTDALLKFSGRLEGVVDTLKLAYACQADGMQQMKSSIQSHDVNRVVFVGCSYRSFLPKLQNLIREAGLNKFLVEMVNARELGAWVHINEKEQANERVRAELKGVVAKAKGLKPLPVSIRDVTQKGLVVGGGVAGMVAALSIASQGIPVDIIEKTDKLGGNANRLSLSYPDSLKKMIKENPRINVLYNAELKELRGRVGRFTARVQTPEGGSTGEYGAIVVAAGGKEYRPNEYLYGSDKNVITQLELEELIKKGGPELKRINSAAVIHCVGSRNNERPYCSRLCCTQAVRNSLKLKEINPKVQIYHLHRDIRTYFLNDILYQNAQKEGVSFIRYDENRGLDVSQKGGLTIRLNDSQTQKEVELKADLLILNAAVLPGEDNKTLSRLLGIPLDKWGFFQEESYMTFSPVVMSKKGISICGLAHGPKTMDESVSQARAAAAEALSVLSKEKLTRQAVHAEVNPGKCIACLTCVRLCPYGVPFINEDRVAQILPFECRGCGICVSGCPNDAIELKSFTDDDVVPQIEAMFV